jgi:hypothetical protein
LCVIKATGEAAVLEEFPDATIMRPSWIYGREDRFFNYYANLKILPFPFAGVPFLDRGLNTVKQPVFVSYFSGLTLPFCAIFFTLRNTDRQTIT